MADNLPENAIPPAEADAAVAGALVPTTLPADTPETTVDVPASDEKDILSEFREQDSNLIEIINSMEADRQKFLLHVRTKISSKETEFEVY